MYRNESQKALPSVSIIVLNYNSFSHLQLCLESLRYLNYPQDKYEVILADNNSIDNSIEFVKSRFPWVNILSLGENYGYAGGNNLAAKKVSSEYIAFLNPDVYVDKNWLLEVASAAIKYEHDSVIAIGGKVKFFGNNELVQVAGSKMCIHGNGMNVGYGDKEGPQYNKIGYTLSPAGCAMLVNKNIFLKLGGFDSDYFMYIEEFDFGYRLWLAGYKCLYVPSATTYHRMSERFRFKVNPFILFHEEKNKLSTIIKDFERTTILKGLCIYYGIFTIKVASYLYSHQFDLIASMIRGNIFFLFELPCTLSKRRIIQSSRKLSDKDMYEKGLMASIKDSVTEFIRLRNFR